MPTILAHAAVPLALGLGLGRHAISRRLLVIGIAASILPDADVVGLRLGVAYSDALGHRGASHSLACALLAGLVAAALATRLRARPLVAFAFVAVCAASHGLLDMLTNGGHGVALWWPLSAERLFFPWRGVEVSPLSLSRFATERGLTVLESELRFIWLPAALLCGALWMRWGRRSGAPAHDR